MNVASTQRLKNLGKQGRPRNERMIGKNGRGNPTLLGVGSWLGYFSSLSLYCPSMASSNSNTCFIV